MSKHKQLPKAEFSRPLEVARVARTGSHEKLTADAVECQALAVRLQVPKIHSLAAALKAKPWRGGGMMVSGEVDIDLDQVSVVSLEEFRSQVRLLLERYFLNRPPAELDDQELDIDPIVNGIIDLGEVVAETIALELDPYPRREGEAFQAVIEDDPAETDKKPNPFNVLKFPSHKG